MSSLIDMHGKAVAMLEYKLAHIPDRVFTNNRKPTISEIYAGNGAAAHMPSIPPNLQLEFVFANYHHFVALKFGARKLEDKMNIALAIWYWQMDEKHCFSRKHKQVRYNILMACIIGASTQPLCYISKEAEEFSTALIDAWLWSVTRQDEFDKQAEFLHLWVSGPFDLMYFSRGQLVRMEKVVKRLEQYVPKHMLSDKIPFWEALKYQPPKFVQTYGPAWAINHIISVETTGKKIDDLEMQSQAEDALASGSFMSSIGSMGLSEAPSGLSPEVFSQPLVQALLQEADEDVEMEGSSHELSCEMWMDPEDACTLFNGTMKSWEKAKDFFSNVRWPQKMEDAGTLAQH